MDLPLMNNDLYGNYPLKNVANPHPHDVLCGRGGGTNAHIGNAHWRALVTANKEMYVSLPKKQKMLLSKSIVNAVRSQNPPGRFLQKDNKTNLWYDVGDQRAQEKTSQALREGAPTIRNSGRPGNEDDDDDEKKEGGSVASAAAPVPSAAGAVAADKKKSPVRETPKAPPLPYPYPSDPMAHRAAAMGVGAPMCYPPIHAARQLQYPQHHAPPSMPGLLLNSHGMPASMPPIPIPPPVPAQGPVPDRRNKNKEKLSPTGKGGEQNSNNNNNNKQKGIKSSNSSVDTETRPSTDDETEEPVSYHDNQGSGQAYPGSSSPHTGTPTSHLRATSPKDHAPSFQNGQAPGQVHSYDDQQSGQNSPYLRDQNTSQTHPYHNTGQAHFYHNDRNSGQMLPISNGQNLQQPQRQSDQNNQIHSQQRLQQVYDMPPPPPPQTLEDQVGCSFGSMPMTEQDYERLMECTRENTFHTPMIPESAPFPTQAGYPPRYNNQAHAPLPISHINFSNAPRPYDEAAHRYSLTSEKYAPLPVDGGLEGGVGFSFGSVMSIGTIADAPNLEKNGLSFGSVMSFSVRGDVLPVDGGLEGIGTSFGSMSLTNDKSVLPVDGGLEEAIGTSFGSILSLSERDSNINNSNDNNRDGGKDNDDGNTAAPLQLAQQKSTGNLLACSDTDSDDDEESAPKSADYSKLLNVFNTLPQQRQSYGGPPPRNNFQINNIPADVQATTFNRDFSQMSAISVGDNDFDQPNSNYYYQQHVQQPLPSAPYHPQSQYPPQQQHQANLYQQQHFQQQYSTTALSSQMRQQDPRQLQQQDPRQLQQQYVVPVAATSPNRSDFQAMPPPPVPAMRKPMGDDSDEFWKPKYQGGGDELDDFGFSHRNQGQRGSLMD